MRRALIIAPELLADGHFDALERLTAALIDALDGGSGTDVTNDTLAATLGASVSKIKQCLTAIETDGLIRKIMEAGNARRIFSQLAAYIVRRRAELGWGADTPVPATAPIPAASGTKSHTAPLPTPPAPPALPPALPALAPALTQPDPPAPLVLFSEEAAEPIGPTNEEIWDEYPKKLEKPSGLKAIADAKKVLEKRYKQAGNPTPKRAAADYLLAITREWAEHMRRRWERETWKGKVCIYASRFYGEEWWTEEAKGEWETLQAVNRGNGQPNGGRRGSAEQRGQFPERINAPVEYFGGGNGARRAHG